MIHASLQVASRIEYPISSKEYPRKPPRRASRSPAAPAVQVIANGGREVDLNALTVQGKVTVVDFYADWCGPCRVMAPELEKIAREDEDVVLRKVDIVKWDTPVCRQHTIRSVPNVPVYDRRGRQVGEAAAVPGIVRANIAKAKS